MQHRTDKAVRAIPIRECVLSLHIGGVDCFLTEKVILNLFITDEQKEECQTLIHHIESISFSHTTLTQESIHELIHAIKELRSFLKKTHAPTEVINEARAAIQMGTENFFEKLVENMPVYGTLEPGQLGYRRWQKLNEDSDRRLVLLNNALSFYHMAPIPLRLRTPQYHPDQNCPATLDAFVCSINENDRCLGEWEHRLRTMNPQELSQQLGHIVHELMRKTHGHGDKFDFILKKMKLFNVHLEKRAHFELNLIYEAIKTIDSYFPALAKTPQAERMPMMSPPPQRTVLPALRMAPPPVMTYAYPYQYNMYPSYPVNRLPMQPVPSMPYPMARPPQRLVNPPPNIRFFNPHHSLNEERPYAVNNIPDYR